MSQVYLSLQNLSSLHDQPSTFHQEYMRLDEEKRNLAETKATSHFSLDALNSLKACIVQTEADAFLYLCSKAGTGEGVTAQVSQKRCNAERQQYLDVGRKPKCGVIVSP